MHAESVCGAGFSHLNGKRDGDWRKEMERGTAHSLECFRNTWKTGHVRRETGGRLGRPNGLEREMGKTSKVSEV